MRIFAGLVVALTLPGAPANAAPADPYVVYVANREVAKGQSPWPVILRADATTGALTEVSRNGHQGSLFVHPYDLAVERDGSLIRLRHGPVRTRGLQPRRRRDSRRSRHRRSEPRLEGGCARRPGGGGGRCRRALYVVENVGLAGDPAVIRTRAR
jgi:hypothetical protein